MMMMLQLYNLHQVQARTVKLLIFFVKLSLQLL